MMRRMSIAFVAAAFPLFGMLQIVTAQEAAIPDEALKGLNGLVGKWECEGQVGGKDQVGGFTCRWARSEDEKKVCLIGHFFYNTGGEVRSGVTLIGWNAARKCIEDRGFDANGGNARLLWTIESPTVWKGDIEAVENGEVTTAKADLVKKSPTEFVYEAEFENGETARIVFRKVKADPKAADEE